jgi:hypothetical protein
MRRDAATKSCVSTSITGALIVGSLGRIARRPASLWTTAYRRPSCQSSTVWVAQKIANRLISAISMPSTQ